MIEITYMNGRKIYTVDVGSMSAEEVTKRIEKMWKKLILNSRY